MSTMLNIIVTTDAHPGKRMTVLNPARVPALPYLASLVCFLLVVGTAIFPLGAASGPPQIISQPANVVAREGEQVSFLAQADGSAPLLIQWQRNGDVIGSGLSFTTDPVTLGNDGDSYSVVVINGLGTATSSNALLKVTPGIEVAASINRSSEVVLYRGWPLVLEVALLHPDSFQSNAVPLLISATSGPWFNALGIDIRDVANTPQIWPLHPAPFTNETIQLTADSGARMLWWLTPEQTAQLQSGDFTITAILNTTNVTRAGAWRGLLNSVPVSLSITDEPATLTPVQEEQKRRFFADYALLQGDPVEAQKQVNALLTAYPTNIGGLTYNVYLQEAAGLFDAAFHSAEAALDQVALQSPDATEPPTELLRKRAELYQIVAPPFVEATRVGEQLLLGWSGYPGFSYRLEASSDLRGWSLVTTNFSVLSNRFSTAVPLGPSPRFFRVAR